ncbi:MAG: hypothetical protein HDR02_15180 [Lachnospiraceae bacterium]|nr:hypothetical protein [Lachnospiraceae bacterium]
MIKDTIIAILAGIAIAQCFNPPDTPARLAIILIVAVTVFMILLEMEDLWDKRQLIKQHIHNFLHQIRSCIRWYLIGLRTWPRETAQRRRRRQLIQDYIRRLREMSPQEHKEQIEEVK